MYPEWTSSGTPTMSTPIHASQNSFQPRAMAYVAIIEPTKIQASHQKYQRGAGQLAPIVAKTCWNTRTPTSQNAPRPMRSRIVAQRGVMAGWSAPCWFSLRTSFQRHQP